jgi:DNA-binding SARP family transcriptional activator/tetratricopeptide (TPR) repeat protein
MIDMTMKPPKLEIHLLGPVEILADQVHIIIPRRVERGILYYLAVEHRPVDRSDLIDLIWPDAEQIDPRATLRTALSRLRNKLPQKDLLITELDQVSLDFSRCQIDLLRFEESYTSLSGILGALPRSQALSDQLVNQIRETLGFWHGDQVIQGDDFHTYPVLADWRHTLNRNLNSHRQFLMKRLAEHFQACGQPERALDLFIQLGRLNYLDIASHLAVVNLLTKLGRHQEAMEFCDALEVIFERMYGAPLPDELLECCRKAQMLIEENLVQEGQGWPTQHAGQLPLVGRTVELGQLRRAYYGGGLVKIRGLIGVGKTRLVQEFFEILSPKPKLILAQAREGERGLPLAPIIHGLRRHVPDQVWANIDCVWANQLTLLFPELTELRPDCSISPVDTLPSARQHLFDALHHLLSLMVKTFGRVLFFLDDAQWADQQTFQALAYLVGQGFFGENGVLIVAGHAGEPGREMDAFFEQFHRTHQVQVIDLPGLNPEEVRLLTQHVLKVVPSPTFVELLYRETDGNPLMVLEILRHVLEGPMDLDALHDLEQLPIPDSIHGLIRRRITQLSDDSRHILTCASVIGTEIPLDLLQAVTELGQGQFFSGIEPLLRSGILFVSQHQQTQQDNLVFSHETMREVVLRETISAYQQILHQKIAHQLSQKADAPDKAVIIADHYLSGGDVVNGFEWLLQAAAHAWMLGASEDTNRVFRQAENIINRAPQGRFTTQHVIQLYKQWRSYAYQSDQADLLEEIGVKLQQIAKRENNPLLMGLSNTVLANACFMHENFETGLLLIKAAIDDLEKFDDPEALIQALFHKALLQWWLLDFQGNLETAHRLLEVTQALPPDFDNITSHTFNAHRAISDSYYAQGEAHKAKQYAEMAYHEFFNQLDTFDKLRACNTLAVANYTAGDVDDCVQFAQQALEIVQKLDNAFLEGLLLVTLAKAEIVKGRLDDAYQHGNRALELAARKNKTHIIVAANTILGDVFNILHNIPQAMQHYRIAQVREGYTSHTYNGLENNIHLGRLLARTGQLDEAREILGTTLWVTEQQGMMGLYFKALVTDGALDVDERNYDAAEEKFAKAVNMAEQRGLAHEVLWAKFRMAGLAYNQAQCDRAEHFLIDVLAQAQSHDMTMLTLHSLELAFQLMECKSLQLTPDQIRGKFRSWVDKLDSYTQSPPLREDFLNAIRFWEEKGYFS